MRVTRRLLAVAILVAIVVALIRYRRNVERTIEEAIQEVSAEWKAAEEATSAASRKNRELPQVILPIQGGTREEDVVTAQAAEDDPSRADDRPRSGPTTNSDKKPSTPPRPVGEGDVDVVLLPQKIGDAKDIGEFWATWSRAIHESRPKVPRITLSRRAPSHRPMNERIPRQPYQDHLRCTEDEVNILRLLHKKFVKGLEQEFAAAPRHGEQPHRQWAGLDIFKGKGVVMVGGGEYFGPAIIGIHMLRRTGSILPVEVFVPDESEYEEYVCENYLKRLGARCVVLSRLFDRSKIKTGQEDDADLKITHYQLKSLALLLSSYSDVLLLDSDSMPVLDPLVHIFQAEPYQSKGLVVWPDFWRSTESPRYWTIAGRSEFPSDLPITGNEAGQLAVNKATHLAPLLLAAYYNIFGPDYYYPLLSQGALGQGDKETYLAAAVALNSTFYRVMKTPVSMGRHDGRKHKATAMVHYNPTDDMKYGSTPDGPMRPMFLHSNAPKMNAGHLVDEGDLLAADGKARLRLLGSREDAIKIFGFDVERGLWDLLVQTGCELQGMIREWKGRTRICERLQEHHHIVFASSP